VAVAQSLPQRPYVNAQIGSIDPNPGPDLRNQLLFCYELTRVFKQSL
jgi:hypothetical protein